MNGHEEKQALSTKEIKVDGIKWTVRDFGNRDLKRFGDRLYYFAESRTVSSLKHHYYKDARPWWSIKRLLIDRQNKENNVKLETRRNVKVWVLVGYKKVSFSPDKSDLRRDVTAYVRCILAEFASESELQMECAIRGLAPKYDKLKLFAAFWFLRSVLPF